VKRKIGFYTMFLSNRGTCNALYDYAYYCKHWYDIEPIIMVCSENRDMDARPKFEKEFEIIDHLKPWKHTRQFMDVTALEKGIESIYYIKSGYADPIYSETIKSMMHVVFPYNEPHGDVYAYVSKWLSDYCTKGVAPYVPHMIDLMRFNHTDDYRSEWGISDNTMVIGSYGWNSLDISWVRSTVAQVARNRLDVLFVFMDMSNFSDAPNVKFLSGTHVEYEKVKFINSCDVFLHGKERGETFGLAVGEFSLKGKPVITPEHVVERAHFDALNGKEIRFTNEDQLYDMLMSIKHSDIKHTDWTAYTGYTPELVMPQFMSVFQP